MDQSDLAAQQDTLRSVRMFVGALQGAFGLDQQSVGYDAQAVNSPYRYQSIGPTGVGVEGAPISSAQGAGVSAAGISPLLLVGLVAVAAFVLPRLVRG